MHWPDFQWLKEIGSTIIGFLGGEGVKTALGEVFKDRAKEVVQDFSLSTEYRVTGVVPEPVTELYSAAMTILQSRMPNEAKRLRSRLNCLTDIQQDMFLIRVLGRLAPRGDDQDRRQANEEAAKRLSSYAVMDTAEWNAEVNILNLHKAPNEVGLKPIARAIVGDMGAVQQELNQFLTEVENDLTGGAEPREEGVR